MQKPAATPVQVSDELFFVLSKAEETSRLSDGAFDVTVGPVVRLWRRARRTRQAARPGQAGGSAAPWSASRTSSSTQKAHTVQLLKAGMQLDLGGIAKGYAADEALEVLKKHGITRALVAAGGDIAVSGPPPDADGWKIAIAPLQNPRRKRSRYICCCNDAAVSTSGDAEQYVEIDGKRYSHIVDPKTGLGLVGRMSVTVVAPNGITSDSQTKIVCVLGAGEGLQDLEKDDGVASASCA